MQHDSQIYLANLISSSKRGDESRVSELMKKGPAPLIDSIIVFGEIYIDFLAAPLCLFEDIHNNRGEVERYVAGLFGGN